MFLTALAIGGLLACGPLRAQQTPPAPPAGGPSTNAPAHALPRGGGIDRLAQALNLTDDQKTQVENLLNTQRQKMTDIRQDDTLSPDDKRAKIKALHDDMNTQMKNILNADQYQKWMSMQTRTRRMSPPPAPAGTNAPPATPNT
jgi:periplasmic protein CpxP/Spy